jgi:hypothetical protein
MKPKMPSVLDQYVGCNECTAEFSVQDAFDAAFKSWPQQSWIAFHCSVCGTTNHLHVERDTVTEGYLDGAPAPCFIVKRIVHIARLYVSVQTATITMKNLNLKWVISSVG